jgi:glycosyltransferase involved in cell wall biosynthesis
METKKKLLILNIPPPYGGGEIRAKLLFDFFSGNEDYHLITNSNENKNKSNQGKVSFKNIRINIAYSLKNGKAIWKHKPKVVYTSIPKDFFPLLKIVPVLLMSKMRGAKLIGELAGRNFYFLEKRGYKYKIGRYLLKKFDSIRVLGNSVLETLNSHGLKKCVVIDNGIEMGMGLVRTSKKIPSPGSPVQFLFIGALSQQKGIFVTLEIIKELVAKDINFQYHIVGEWKSEKDKNEAFTYIRNYNLESNIVFHGVLLREKKWQLLSSSDIFIFPSFNEGQPLVVIEAMAFGLPVISSSVGAIPDTMEEGVNGFMIKSNESNEFVERILSIIKNPELFASFSESNLKTYEKRYTSAQYCQNIQNWIEKQAV